MSLNTWCYVVIFMSRMESSLHLPSSSSSWGIGIHDRLGNWTSVGVASSLRQDGCRPNPCRNDAICEAKRRFVICRCAPGFVGAFCEEKLKPAIIWNTPSKNCVHRHLPEGLTFADMKIIANRDEDFLGTKIITFYRLGLEPYIDKKTLKQYYGGIPQAANMTRHLKKMRKDIERHMPDPEYNGLVAMDFEAWRLHWARLFSNFDRYKELSRKYAIKTIKNLTRSTDIEFHAKRLYNAAARNFITQTFLMAKKLRPRAKWGLYKFPECYNDHHPSLTSCSLKQQALNDDLLWVVHLSDVLFPSTYLFYDHDDPAKRFHAQIAEARRLAKAAGKPDLPVWKFTNIFGSGGKTEFMSVEELHLAFGSSFTPAGPDGIVLWGSSLPFRNRGFCANLTDYLVDTLGPYLRHAYRDECRARPCANGGVCVDALFRFECACAPGFAGAMCEDVVDPCVSAPCGPRGTCVSAMGLANGTEISPPYPSAFICLCPSDLTGQTCESRLDPCVSSPCVNGGVCVTVVAGVTVFAADGEGDDGEPDDFGCVCPAPYFGRRCTLTDPCHSTPCLNGGVCQRRFGGSGYSCACDAFHAGERCQTRVRPCVDAICNFRGSCVIVNTTVVCECFGGRRGRYCDYEDEPREDKVTDGVVSDDSKSDKESSPPLQQLLWHSATVFVAIIIVVGIYVIIKSIKKVFRRRRQRSDKSFTSSDPSSFSEEERLQLQDFDRTSPTSQKQQPQLDQQQQERRTTSSETVT